MHTVKLCAKAQNNSQLRAIDEVLKSALEGLQVEVKLLGATSRGWVQVTVSGEDERIALNYLTKEIGLCPSRLEDISKFMILKGRIAELDKNKGEVSIDVGISSPDNVNATIPLHRLQAQLIDGRKTALDKIAEVFGFCKNLPLTVKILDTAEEDGSIDATLAESQLTQYRNWTRSLLDRLIILGASLQDIEWVLKTAECNRDVLNVEPLGCFEHAVICKLGTDAAGLIPKIGSNLRHAAFTVFSPKRILEFLGRESSWLIS